MYVSITKENIDFKHELKISKGKHWHRFSLNSV